MMTTTSRKGGSHTHLTMIGDHDDHDLGRVGAEPGVDLLEVVLDLLLGLDSVVGEP